MTLLQLSAATLVSGLSLLPVWSTSISESQTPFIQKYAKQKNIIPPAKALILTDPEPELTEGFTSLYNGKDLSGWTPVGGTCTFEATPEAIVGTCVPGSPSTYLITEKDDYQDFVFTAELKWLEDGNSGVLFRSKTHTLKSGQLTAIGPQAEMEGFEGHNGQRQWSGGIYGQGYAAWIYPLWLDAHQKVRAALRKDDWNRITIQTSGRSVRTWINGIPAAHVLETHGFHQGFFGLQVHNGKKGTVLFRNLKVKEVPRVTEDLFGNNDFSAWQTLKGTPVSTGWSIKDGIVHRGDDRPGNIATRKSYQNFDFRFEWKISEGGNSGVKYRTQGRLGLEYQILDDQTHKDGKNPSHRSASLYDLLAAPDDKPIKPVGEWNQARIVVDDTHIEHWLNGERVLSIDYGSDEWAERFGRSKYKEHEGFGTWDGPILLQDHGDEVWFRNVHLQEL